MTGTPFGVNDKVEFPVDMDSDRTRSGIVELAVDDLRIIKCSKTNNPIVRRVVDGKLEVPPIKSEIDVEQALTMG